MAEDSNRSSWIKALKVENYGCVRDATLNLTSLHALIGPNDSGKSTLLRALQDVCRSVQGDATVLQMLSPNARLLATIAPSGLKYPVGRGSGTAIPPGWNPEGVRGAFLLRADPDELRKPWHLIPDQHPIAFQNDRGLGLASVIDAITDRQVAERVALDEEVQRLFPTVERIQLKVVSGNKTLGVRLRSGIEVAPERMSEGLLYYLAFAVLRLVQPTGILLVEEPENGLHPARIKEVVGILREISKTRQVVLATHSPLVINELAPDEVTVVTRRTDAGTELTLMKETPHFAERTKVYALGELWVSYADGLLEEPLLGAVKKA